MSTDAKRCRSCKLSKPRADYFFDNTIERRICKDCVSDIIKNGRTCNKCGEHKSINEFRQCTAISWHRTCKACMYLQDADSVRQNPRRKAYHVIHEKKQVAKRNGLKFDLDVDWYMKRINNGYCEVTKIDFFLHNLPGNVAHPHQPAIDRIIPGGDYTKANCRLVCRIFNIARGNYSDKDFLDMCQRVVKYGLGT